MSLFKKRGALLFALLLLLLSSGCNIDIPIENHHTDPDVLTSVRQAGELLTSAYLSVPTNELEYSVLAGDFKPTVYSGRTPELLQLNNWQPKQIEQLSLSVWKRHYETILASQALLERLASFTPTDPKEQEELDNIHAEALLLRINAYMELLQLFATPYKEAPEVGIIIKHKEYEPDQKRSTKEEVLRHISELFRQAEELQQNQKEGSDHRLLGVSARKLLKARYHMYKAEYDQVIRIAEEMLRHSPISTLSPSKLELTDYTTGSSNRVIWSLQGAFEQFYGEVYSLEIGDKRWQHGFIPQPLLHEEYQREPYTILHNGQRLLGKYLLAQMRSSKILSIPKMRQAELLFIYAEALLHIAQIDAATSILKQYYGHSPSQAPLTLQNLFELKRQEFIGEGINLFDAKRLNLPISIYNTKGEVINTIKAGDYRRTWPIPAKEILPNALSIEQNTGWPIYKKRQ